MGHIWAFAFLLLTGTSMVTMRLDGRDLTLLSAKWTAYEASRSAKLVPIEGHELVATSRLRMVPGEAGLMWEVGSDSE